MANNGIKMSGIVKKMYSMSEFDVELENKVIVKGVISGKIRKFNIRILPGDKVDLEISPYDLTKGRITYRH